jgi:hypothetical protein
MGCERLDEDEGGTAAKARMMRCLPHSLQAGTTHPTCHHATTHITHHTSHITHQSARPLTGLGPAMTGPYAHATSVSLLGRPATAWAGGRVNEV